MSEMAHGGIDFLSISMIWRNRRLMWKLIRNYHIGTKISTSLITRRASSCGIISPLESTGTEEKNLKISARSNLIK